MLCHFHLDPYFFFKFCCFCHFVFLPSYHVMRKMEMSERVLFCAVVGVVIITIKIKIEIYELIFHEFSRFVLLHLFSIFFRPFFAGGLFAFKSKHFNHYALFMFSKLSPNINYLPESNFSSSFKMCKFHHMFQSVNIWIIFFLFIFLQELFFATSFFAS